MAKDRQWTSIDTFLPSPTETETRLAAIVAADPRYPKDAYLFVQQGMEKVHKMHWRPSAFRHISAVELLEGLRVLAIESFGKRAKVQLNSWRILRCEDIGEIVFNLVEARLWAKQPEDTKADFQGSYDFDAAFPS